MRLARDKMFKRAIRLHYFRPRPLMPAALILGLAFAVILATNLLVVLGSWRVRRASPALVGSPANSAPEPNASHSDAAPASFPGSAAPSRRWIFDVVLLAFLAIGGVILWLGNQPLNSQAGHVKGWIHTHLHR